MGAKSTRENAFDKKIVLSVQQALTYGAFFITIGASIYTFFKAIPKIDRLDDSVNQLQVTNAHVQERISRLNEILDKAGSENKKLQ